MIRAHQPGSIPIDIPETVPNPAYEPQPARPVKVPEREPAKTTSPGAIRGFFFM